MRITNLTRRCRGRVGRHSAHSSGLGRSRASRTRDTKVHVDSIVRRRSFCRSYSKHSVVSTEKDTSIRTSRETTSCSSHAQTGNVLTLRSRISAWRARSVRSTTEQCTRRASPATSRLCLPGARASRMGCTPLEGTAGWRRPDHGEARRLAGTLVADWGSGKLWNFTFTFLAG